LYVDVFLRKVFDKTIEMGQNPSKKLKICNHLAAVQRNAFDTLSQCREMLVAYEQTHDIEERWTPDTEKW